MMDSKINEEYVEEKVTKIKDEDVELVMKNEEAISKKLSNASPLRKYAELGKIMFAMLKDVKKRHLSKCAVVYNCLHSGSSFIRFQPF